MKSLLQYLALFGIALGALFGLLPAAHAGDGALLVVGVGMIVDRGALDNIFIALHTEYASAFAAAPSQWEQVGMRIPSSASLNDYKWLSRFPRMQKWVGEKTLKQFEGFKYVVVNDDWEATVIVDRNDIEDDQLGIYSLQARDAGFSAAQLPDQIVFQLVANAFNTACFDGRPFFDTAHPLFDVKKKATFSNMFELMLSADSQEAAIATLGQAAMQMRLFTDYEQRPLGVVPDTLLVGPQLEAIANTLYVTDRLNDGKANLYKGLYKPVVSPWIRDSSWSLLDTSKPLKPFIYQERKAPVFVQQVDPNADSVFMRKQFKFGAEARAAGGYGFPQLAFGSTGTVAPS